MRWQGLFLLLPLLAQAETPRVEVRASQVWLIVDGSPRQLTTDGNEKDGAELSPARKRIAYFEQCSDQHPCRPGGRPAVVVLDLEGQRLKSFEPGAGRGKLGCGSISSIAWTGEGTIAVECHMNPSLNDYIETDIATGEIRRRLLGLDFTPSPDGAWIAHSGWIVHFAPPYAQSSYLQVDDTTIYPLPAGVKPTRQVGLTAPPEVVAMKGQAYLGIHEFHSKLFWSPDSQRIALIDCLFDYTPNQPESLGRDGKESARRCSLAVVSPSGKVALFPLPDFPTDRPAEIKITWINPHLVSILLEGKKKLFNIR